MNKKKVKATPVAKGTILFSHHQYKGIFIEYRLNQFRQEYYELFVYPKTYKNVKADYNIGLNYKLEKDGKIIYSEQKSFIEGKVIQHGVKSNSENTILLVEGVKKTKINAIKLKLRVGGLDGLDLWISMHGVDDQNYSELDLIKIPNLMDYKPPIEDVNIFQAYPDFRERKKNGETKQWWINRMDHLVCEFPTPNVKWRDIFLDLGNVELNNKNIIDVLRKITYGWKNYDGDNTSLGLNNLHFVGNDDNGGHLVVDNLGPECQLYLKIEGDGRNKSMVIPEDTYGFQISVSGYDFNIHLQDKNGPILFKHDLKNMNATVECVVQQHGFWLYVTNSYPYTVKILVEFKMLNGVCDSSLPIEPAESKIPPTTKQRKWFRHPFNLDDYTIVIFLLNQGQKYKLNSKTIVPQQHTSSFLNPNNCYAEKLADIASLSSYSQREPEIKELKKKDNEKIDLEVDIEVSNKKDLKLGLKKENIEVIQDQKNQELISVIRELTNGTSSTCGQESVSKQNNTEKIDEPAENKVGETEAKEEVGVAETKEENKVGVTEAKEEVGVAETKEENKVELTEAKEEVGVTEDKKNQGVSGAENKNEKKFIKPKITLKSVDEDNKNKVKVNNTPKKKRGRPAKNIQKLEPKNSLNLEPNKPLRNGEILKLEPKKDKIVLEPKKDKIVLEPKVDNVVMEPKSDLKLSLNLVPKCGEDEEKPKLSIQKKLTV